MECRVAHARQTRRGRKQGDAGSVRQSEATEDTCNPLDLFRSLPICQLGPITVPIRESKRDVVWSASQRRQNQIRISRLHVQAWRHRFIVHDVRVHRGPPKIVTAATASSMP